MGRPALIVYHIALNINTRFGNSTGEAPVKFHCSRTNLNPFLATSRLILPANSMESPTSAPVLPHSWWIYIWILIKEPWQFIKDLSWPSGKVLHSTLSFVQSQSVLFMRPAVPRRDYLAIDLWLDVLAAFAWWRHQWKHFPRYWPFVRGITGYRWIPRSKASDAELWCFLLVCAWTNGWVSNRDADHLRRHRAHYGVTVMCALD